MWSHLSLHSNKGSHLRTSGEHEFLSFARCHTGIHPNEIIHFIRVTCKIMAALWVKVSFLPSIAAIMVSIDLWSKSCFQSRVNWYASSSRSICPWARSRTFCVFSADLPITSANWYSCWAIVKPVPLTWPYKVFLKFAHGWSVGCNVPNVTRFFYL